MLSGWKLKWVLGCSQRAKTTTSAKLKAAASASQLHYKIVHLQARNFPQLLPCIVRLEPRLQSCERPLKGFSGSGILADGLLKNRFLRGYRQVPL